MADLGDTYRPHVSVDPAGNALAVWQQSDGARYNIWANRFTVGRGWGTPVLVEQDNSGHAGFPSGPVRVGLDNAGDGLAVWTQYDGSQYSIWANRFLAASGWGTSALIEIDNAGEAIEPQLAVSLDGGAVAVWSHWDSARYNIWANRYDPVGGWGPAAPIEGQAGNARYPHVAVIDGGTAVAVWTQHDPSTGVYNIWANRFVPGVGWVGALPLETNDAGHAGIVAGPPRVALDDAGNADVVWQQWDGSRYSIFWNRFVSGSGWGSAALLESDNSGEAETPQVAANPSGNAVAVWRQSDGSRFNCWASVFLPSVGWSSPALIETENINYVLDPQVSIDPLGRSVVVWVQHDYARQNAWANRFVPGVGWGTATLLEMDNYGDHAYTPQVDMDASGNAIAVWQQYINARQAIWANRFVQDNVPPFLLLFSPTVDVTGSPTITIAGTTEPGASLTVNGTATGVASDGSFSTPFTLTEGPNAIPVIAMDYEGNAAQRTVLITLDTVDPNPAFSTPSDGALLATNVVRVTGTVSDSGSGVASVSVNGIVLENSSPWSVDILLPEGSQTLWVKATDRAGNTISVSRAVTIDTNAPGLTVDAPRGGFTNVSVVTVSGTTEPGATVTIDGNAVLVDSSGGFSDNVTLPEGSHTFTIVATDAAGNVASVGRTVTVDTVAPTITLVAPSNGAVTRVPTIVVSGTTEPGALVVVNGLVASVDPTGAFSVTVALSVGTNGITATAVDEAGNRRTSSRNVTFADPVPGLEQDLRDSLGSLRNSLNATRDDLNEARSRLDAAGVQSILILILLIVLLVLNAFQMLRGRSAGPPKPPKPRKPAKVEPPARPVTTESMPEEWREPPPAAPPPVEHTLAVEQVPAEDTATQLARLDAMKAEGLISDEEYKTRRRDILEQL